MKRLLVLLIFLSCVCNGAQTENALEKQMLELARDSQTAALVFFLDTHKYDVNINAKDELGRTVLWYLTAIPLRNPVLRIDIVGDIDRVLSLGANPNIADFPKKRTPLMNAAVVGSKDIIDNLLKNKARINDQDVSGFTALDYATTANKKVAMNILKKANGKVKAQLEATSDLANQLNGLYRQLNELLVRLTKS